MLKYRDFLPNDQSGPLALKRDYEHFDSLVERANAWTSARGIEVMHAETVVLPNLKPSRNSESSAQKANSSGFTQWAQILRIWYRE